MNRNVNGIPDSHNHLDEPTHSSHNDLDVFDLSRSEDECKTP